MEEVLDVIRYLSFGCGVIEFPVSIAEKDADISWIAIFNTSKVRVWLSILSQTLVVVLYFCYTISILTGDWSKLSSL